MHLRAILGLGQLCELASQPVAQAGLQALGVLGSSAVTGTRRAGLLRPARRSWLGGGWYHGAMVKLLALMSQL